MSRSVESRTELARRGSAARESLSLRALADFEPGDRDIVELIARQNASRVPELLPLRAERMSQSAFTFYRGTANIMAFDLAQQTSTGLDLVICGDAHISNFGLFASPERKLIFDLNDFDEAATGPFEWDVRRLVTSAVIAARTQNFRENDIQKIAKSCAESYRVALASMLEMPALDRLFSVRDEDSIRDGLSGDKALKIFDAAAKKAKKRTNAKASKKLLERASEGEWRFIENPPVLTHVETESAEFLEELFEEYLKTVRPDVALLLSTYQLTDVVLRVVGVGSVGTRCYLVALTGPDEEHLILQIKEASESVVATNHVRAEPSIDLLPPSAPHGQRVITYQQVMQAASDPFLGHIEGREHQFYVRQFRDQKGSIEIDGMSPSEFEVYARGCASLLARAHSQSPLAPAVQHYLGSSDDADAAFAQWADSYANQVDKDFATYRRSL